MKNRLDAVEKRLRELLIVAKNDSIDEIVDEGTADVFAESQDATETDEDEDSHAPAEDES